MLNQIIDERFEVLHKIGEGGMASVYLCNDRETNKNVALKIVTIQSGDKGFTKRRFKREFSLTKRVNHPNIISIHHFGSIDDTSLYTVMDYISGKDLYVLLEDEGQLSEKLTQKMALKLAGALAALHDADVIHRDLKPANIMIVDGTEPIIMDFGLARAMDLTRMTETGTILGTPIYMAPEQTQGEAVDNRSDIYQLGVIIFEMLTGRTPFGGRTIAELLTNILETEAPLVSTVNPTLSPRWDGLIARCLEKDPEERFQSARELIEELEKVFSPLGKELGPTKRHDKGNEPSPRGDETKTRKYKESSYNGLAIGFLFIFLVIGLYFFFSKSRQHSYTHENLEVDSSLTGITIRWQSKEAYPTAIKLLSPEVRLVKENEAETTDHFLEIKDLKEGTSYTFRIVYPGQRSSLLKRATTKRFRVDVLSGKEEGKSLQIICRVSPPLEEIEVRPVGGGVTSSKPTVNSKGLVKTTLTGPYWNLNELELIASYDAKTIKRSSLRDPLLREMETHCRSLRELDRNSLLEEVALTSAHSPAAFVRKLSNESNESLPDDKKRRLDELLTTWKRDQKRLFVSWTRACELSQLILGTKILSLDHRLEFDNSLNTMMALSTFYVYETGRETPFPLANRGQFAFTARPMELKCFEIPLLKREAKNLLRLGINLVTSSKAKKKWQKDFTITDLQKYDRAEFAFGYSSFDNACMVVNINSVKLQLLSHRQIEPKGLVPFQRIPIEALLEGLNKLELSHEALASSHMDAQIDVLSCNLRLYEKTVP